MWTDETISNILKNMIDHYGYEILSDSRRCAAYVQDMLFDYEREKRILTMLIKEGLFSVISNYPYSKESDLNINLNIMNEFMKEYALDSETRLGIISSLRAMLYHGTINSQFTPKVEKKEEFFSIRDLLSLKQTSELLIVVKDTWHNDYCFVVDGIGNDGYAFGKTYLNGNEYGTSCEGGRTKRFKLYNGPSQKIILSKHHKDYVRDNDSTLIGFWKNRGFSVVDERNIKKNGWLFVKGTKEELSPYLDMVSQRFGVNGRYEPYYRALKGSGWGTISCK